MPIENLVNKVPQELKEYIFDNMITENESIKIRIINNDLEEIKYYNFFDMKDPKGNIIYVVKTVKCECINNEITKKETTIRKIKNIYNYIEAIIQELIINEYYESIIQIQCGVVEFDSTAFCWNDADDMESKLTRVLKMVESYVKAVY